MTNIDHFERMFSAFKRTAFRLETLTEYRIEGEEWDEFQSFLRGAPLPSGANAPWAREVEGWTRAGRRVIRVRLLSEALSAYLRYEVEWCYPVSIAAGEDIRFMTRQKAESLVKNEAHLKDFWLFDESEALMMHYEPDGSYAGENVVTAPEQVQPLRQIANILTEHATPAETFYRQLRLTELKVNVTDDM